MWGLGRVLEAELVLEAGTGPGRMEWLWTAGQVLCGQAGSGLLDRFCLAGTGSECLGWVVGGSVLGKLCDVLFSYWVCGQWPVTSLDVLAQTLLGCFPKISLLVCFRKTTNWSLKKLSCRL